MLLQRESFSTDPLTNLRLAASIELSTLPPYLYAAWSVRPREDGGAFAATQAAQLIRSVAYEEMLHLALVTNVINALGGTIELTALVPTYPGPLPGHVTTGPYAFSVSLEPLSQSAIRTFKKIELPEWLAPPPGNTESEEWITLAEFYRELQGQLRALPDCDFQHGRQLPPSNNPSPSFLNPVSDRTSAVTALETIVRQGEGTSQTNQGDGAHELAHYYKFDKIFEALQKGEIQPARDVFPVVKDPKPDAYSVTQQALNLKFNTLYSLLLDTLQAGFASMAPDVYATATNIMNPLVQAAISLRGAGTIGGTGQVAGPTFAYLPKNSGKA